MLPAAEEKGDQYSAGGRTIAAALGTVADERFRTNPHETPKKNR
jgi:hypothetical protein